MVVLQWLNSASSHLDKLYFNKFYRYAGGPRRVNSYWADVSYTTCLAIRCTNSNIMRSISIYGPNLFKFLNGRGRPTIRKVGLRSSEVQLQLRTLPLQCTMHPSDPWVPSNSDDPSHTPALSPTHNYARHSYVKFYGRVCNALAENPIHTRHDTSRVTGPSVMDDPSSS